jgi:hypothetical protein
MKKIILLGIVFILLSIPVFSYENLEYYKNKKVENTKCDYLKILVDNQYNIYCQNESIGLAFIYTQDIIVGNIYTTDFKVLADITYHEYCHVHYKDKNEDRVLNCGRNIYKSNIQIINLMYWVLSNE